MAAPCLAYTATFAFANILGNPHHELPDFDMNGRLIGPSLLEGKFDILMIIMASTTVVVHRCHAPRTSQLQAPDSIKH